MVVCILQLKHYLMTPTCQVRLVENEAEEYETDSGEEEEWWHPEVKQGEKVQVTKDFASAVYSFMQPGVFHPQRENNREEGGDAP